MALVICSLLVVSGLDDIEMNIVFDLRWEAKEFFASSYNLLIITKRIIGLADHVALDPIVLHETLVEASDVILGLFESLRNLLSLAIDLMDEMMACCQR